MLSRAWWMLGAFCVMALPAFFFVPHVGHTAWGIVLLSGSLEAAYFVTLTGLIRRAICRRCTPVARGSAQLFLLCWAALFLGERPTPAGLGGIASIISGLYLINLPAISEWKRPLLDSGPPHRAGPLLRAL